MDKDDRIALWQALDTVGASLGDGYRDAVPLPDFSDAARADAGPSRPEPRSPSRALGRVPAGGRTPDSRPAEDLGAIEAEASRCLKCRLASGRTRVVFGQGVRAPSVLVIGEGPGAEEDARGLPFVGPAGQLLDRMLLAIGLSRETNVYIANIVKCRPPMNRDPAPDEQAACRGYLDRQLEALRPRAVLAVGRIPAQALLGVKDGIGKLRGRVWDFRGLPLVPTYHPSALLRDETLKRPAWEDLKLLKALLPDA